MRNYKPATFQPTIRQDWSGILSYISEKEKAEILTALFKYPTVECESLFWKETIKPDLDLQYEMFKSSCEAKSRGIRNRWGKISITDVEDMNKICNTDVIDAKSKSKSKEIYLNNNNINNNNNIYNIQENKNFVPPTLEEFLNWAKEQNNFAGVGGFSCTKTQAEQFWHHYNSQNWVTGNNIPIWNWQHKFREWCLKDNQKAE
jgi:hypothetical protein